MNHCDHFPRKDAAHLSVSVRVYLTSQPLPPLSSSQITPAPHPPTPPSPSLDIKTCFHQQTSLFPRQRQPGPLMLHPSR